MAAGLLFISLPRLGFVEPITPTRDDEIVEVLPASSGTRAEDRRLRKQLADRSGDATLAIMVARRDLERAREAGDPRFAGLALAALHRWTDAATAPDEVLLLRATLLQYMHDFDASVANLRLLLARPGGERMAQASLTLADGVARAGRLRRVGRGVPACRIGGRSSAFECLPRRERGPEG